MPSLHRERFLELLPFYVNGKLQGEDLAFMERYLSEHPMAAHDVKFATALCSMVKNTGAGHNHHEGWNRLLQEYRQLKGKVSMMARIRHFCGEWGLTPAFALAATIVVIQGTVITAQLSNLPEHHYRSGSQPAIQAAHIRLIASPKASFAELALLLRRHGCTIISGPSETGEVWVILDQPEQRDQIRRALIESNLVDEATLLP